MPRPNDEARLAEVNTLVGWCDAVVDAMALRLPEYASSMLRNVVREAALKQDLKGLRGMVLEFEWMTADFPAEEQNVLSARLKAQFGRGLRDKTDGMLRRILKRGTLKTDDEFRVLREQLDDQDKSATLDEEQKARIGSMLLAYESR